MQKISVCTVVVVVLLLHFEVRSQTTIGFYDQNLNFGSTKNFVFKKKLRASEEDFKKYIDFISRSRNNSLLDSLLRYRKEFQLNDWLYYILIDRVSSKVERTSTNANYLKGYLLGKSGFKLRIAFSNDHVWIQVASTELVTGLRKDDKFYCINCQGLRLRNYFVPLYNPFLVNQKSFSFVFNPLPHLRGSKVIDRLYKLELPDSVIVFRNEFNSALINALKDRMNFNVSQTFTVPLSKPSMDFLTKIEKAMENYSDSMKIEILTKFVVNNSKYTSDIQNFGREKWLTPEEFLFYGSGDCEDRCSFLFYALHKILDYPMVIIDYPEVNHLNIGISLNLKIKPNFFYGGLGYYIIEPTTERAGDVPLGKSRLAEENRFEIISEEAP